jgi:hypothetical protein
MAQGPPGGAREPTETAGLLLAVPNGGAGGSPRGGCEPARRSGRLLSMEPNGRGEAQ